MIWKNVIDCISNGKLITQVVKMSISTIEFCQWLKSWELNAFYAPFPYRFFFSLPLAILPCYDYDRCVTFQIIFLSAWMKTFLLIHCDLPWQRIHKALCQLIAWPLPSIECCKWRVQDNAIIICCFCLRTFWAWSFIWPIPSHEFQQWYCSWITSNLCSK